VGPGPGGPARIEVPRAAVSVAASILQLWCPSLPPFGPY
jgi:hypothetical protein